MFFSDWLRRRKRGKPRAILFVDYEHWYYSYLNLYHMKPKIHAWYDEMAAAYEIVDCHVFGAFSQMPIKSELAKIREITNSIIETDNEGPFHKKDMTDFIMLDYLYQNALDKNDVDVYVLFTGDGHFQSVVKYLTQRKRKKVVVCGVKGGFSKQLQAVATTVLQLPSDAETTMSCYKMIVDNFSYIAEHPQKKIIPTFLNMVDAVARHNHIEPQIVQVALNEMIARGLVVKWEYRVEFNKNIRILAADWEQLHAAGLWEYPT